MSESALSSIAEINPGTRIPLEINGSDEVSFIPMSDVSESGDWITHQTRPLCSVTAGYTAFEEGDVLVAKITPCLENGKGAHARRLRNGIGFGSTEFHVLRAKQGIEPRFVFHLTQSRLFRRAAERQMVGSAGQQRVPRQFFDEFLVRDFSQGEQRAIAQVLDTLDTTIRETEALIDKFKSVKQGLLHDLLTRGIDANGQLRPALKDVPQLYKETSLGWVPREWEVAQLANLLADFDPAMRSGPFGSALLKEELVEVGLPLLGIDNVHTERFIAEFKRCVTPEKFQQLSRYAVRPADLMITIMGTVGRCCLVPDDLGLALSSKHTWTISLDQNRYSPFLAMLQVNYSPWVAQHFVRDQQGGTMMAIRSDTLRSLQLPVPPRDEQDAIETRLREVGNCIDAETAALEKMKLEKSGLMDDLLTGRVRVTPLLESMQQAAAPTEA
ncbi:restriction endonuclease subunit S [Pseudomonas soli]|uniref:restriction endonuclease subunit S n=1 Tax=Pseudomonas soli TaxID=1306993 RepID=UPI003CFFD6E5